MRAVLSGQNSFISREISNPPSSLPALLCCRRNSRRRRRPRLMVRNRTFWIRFGSPNIGRPTNRRTDQHFFGVEEESLKSERDAPCNTYSCALSIHPSSERERELQKQFWSAHKYLKAASRGVRPMGVCKYDILNFSPPRHSPE